MAVGKICCQIWNFALPAYHSFGRGGDCFVLPIIFARCSRLNFPLTLKLDARNLLLILEMVLHLNRFRPIDGPTLPVQQDPIDAHVPLLRQTTTAISPEEGETTNREQETRSNPIKPQYTVEQIGRLFEADFSKHTRGHIAGDAFWATTNAIATITKSMGTAAFTAVTLPWFLKKIFPQNSEAYLYSALFLSPYFMKGVMAGANEMERQMLKATDALMQRALIRQYVRISYKESTKIINGISDYVFGGWRPTLPRKAAMMAQTMRGRRHDSKFEYHELQARLAIVDKAIDKYLENGKPGDIDAFDKFLHHLKAWELMARAPLPDEVSNLSHEEKNGDPARQAKFDAAQKEVETMAPETIRHELSGFMADWRLSTLPGTSPSKDFIALVGDTELPDGTDLAEEICKKITEKDPVIVTADHLNEFIDVVLSKEAVPRVKQKTGCPIEALGPFVKWIESGNSACPIVIKDVDFKNPKHARLIDNLRKSTEIDIHYDEIKGSKFTVNTQRTRFILCARKPDDGSEMSHPVAHAIIGSPSEDDRCKVLDLTLRKQRRDVLDKLSYTDEQKYCIEELIRRRYADFIIKKSMKRNLDYPSMRKVINRILIEVSSGYKRIGALKGGGGTQQEPSAFAEGEAGSSLAGRAKEAFDNALEKFIEEKTSDDALEKFIKARFKAFPERVEAKGKKDAKGKKVAEKLPQEADVWVFREKIDKAAYSRWQYADPMRREGQLRR